MKEKGGNASEDDRHGGYYGKKQDQDSCAQYPDAPRRGEGQGQCSAGEDGQCGRHQVQAVAGAAVFFDDFAGFVGATSLLAADGPIAGTGRSTLRAIRALSSFHNTSGTERT